MCHGKMQPQEAPVRERAGVGDEGGYPQECVLSCYSFQLADFLAFQVISEMLEMTATPHSLSRTVVLSRGDSVPQGTFDNVCRHF